MHPALNIVAIGGGHLLERETTPIDAEIVRLTGKSNPVALFIPTASNDRPDYVDVFRDLYIELGCQVEVLAIAAQDPSPNEVAEKIARADLVYVGGGNTRTMLIRWKEIGVDRALWEAGLRGAILSGLSAGANCWFRYANSDAPMIEGAEGIATIRLDCLGWIDLAVCPHYSREVYRPDEMRKMMLTTPGMGIGIEDGAAIHVRGGEYRILSAWEDTTIHHVGMVEGEFYSRRLEASREFRPFAELQGTPIGA